MGVVKVTWLIFSIFGSPNHIFAIDEARYFKFRVRIDTEEYYCTSASIHEGKCV